MSGVGSAVKIRQKVTCESHTYETRLRIAVSGGATGRHAMPHELPRRVPLACRRGVRVRRGAPRRVESVSIVLLENPGKGHYRNMQLRDATRDIALRLR